MERKLAEPTFADAVVADLGGPRTRAFLDRCQELIPWVELANSIKHLFPEQPLGGRPFTPAPRRRSDHRAPASRRAPMTHPTSRSGLRA